MSPSTAAVLFIAFPYIAVVLFIGVAIWRYVRRSFSYSSLSSQFLENEHQFWASTAFHWGILFVLGGHLVAFCIPREIQIWNSQPIRLLALEISALAGGLLAIIGLIGFIRRRMLFPRMRAVTTHVDVILLWLLAIQIVSGLAIAWIYPWGSSWYASTMVPYLWSLLLFQPDISAMSAMPTLVITHVVGAFVIIAFFPFTRLVHVLVAPLPYLLWKQQHQRWYADRRTVRSSGRSTTHTQARS